MYGDFWFSLKKRQKREDGKKGQSVKESQEKSRRLRILLMSKKFKSRLKLYLVASLGFGSVLFFGFLLLQLLEFALGFSVGIFPLFSRSVDLGELYFLRLIKTALLAFGLPALILLPLFFGSFLWKKLIR